MKPGKKDHYTKKVNGEKSHVQKRYLLWPLRATPDMVNGSDLSAGDFFKNMFEKELSFTFSYKFIKVHKQYIFNCKIPQNASEFLKTCQNVVLFAWSLNQACKKSIPCDPHVIVEEYSCNSNKKDCMLSICEECKSHGLEKNDFSKRNYETDENDGDSSSSSDSDGNDDTVCKYLQWKKKGGGGQMDI